LWTTASPPRNLLHLHPGTILGLIASGSTRTYAQKRGQDVTQNALTRTSCDQASIYARFAQRIWSLERAMLR
jgi:hypothetical protein